jgi:hypothetical protein
MMTSINFCINCINHEPNKTGHGLHGYCINPQNKGASTRCYKIKTRQNCINLKDRLIKIEDKVGLAILQKRK